MPKVRRPKKGWAVPKTSRRRNLRVKAPNNRLPRCPSCGQWSMKRDVNRGESYCTSCGVIGR